MQIINKREIPIAPLPSRTRTGGRLQVLDALSLDEAVKIECDTREQVEKMRINLCGCVRQGRRNYRLRTRAAADGDKFLLYVWKEMR